MKNDKTKPDVYGREEFERDQCGQTGTDLRAASAAAARGICSQCGCTDDNACLMPAQGAPGTLMQTIPCSWADEAHTLCTACKFEDEALAKAGAGILHIFKQMAEDGLVTVDLDTRSKIAAGLVSAYLAGFGEATAEWKQWADDEGSDEGMPRDITLDIRPPYYGNQHRGPRIQIQKVTL
jgi:hypothetical protein